MLVYEKTDLVLHNVVTYMPDEFDLALEDYLVRLSEHRKEIIGYEGLLIPNKRFVFAKTNDIKYHEQLGFSKCKLVLNGITIHYSSERIFFERLCSMFNSAPYKVGYSKDRFFIFCDDFFLSSSSNYPQYQYLHYSKKLTVPNVNIGLCKCNEVNDLINSYQNPTPIILQKLLYGCSV